jgi:hypothetical protein
MKPKNTTKVFLTLISIFLTCTSSVLAYDQVQNQTGMIDELKNNWNTFCFYGEAVLSGASYKVNQLFNTNAEGDNVTIQTDLDYWNDLKAQYPFSDKPVFISMNSIFGSAYVPEGISEITVIDNSGNALDSYAVTKNETGFTIQVGAPDDPDNNCTITLKEIKEFDGMYGNLEEVKVDKMYVKEQIQEQIKNEV